MEEVAQSRLLTTEGHPPGTPEAFEDWDLLCYNLDAERHASQGAGNSKWLQSHQQMLQRLTAARTRLIGKARLTPTFPLAITNNG